MLVLVNFSLLSVFVSSIAARKVNSAGDEAVVIDGVIYKVNGEEYEAADGTVLYYSNDDTELVYKNNDVIAYTIKDGKLYNDENEEVSFKLDLLLDIDGNAVNEDGKIIRSIYGPDAIVIEEIVYILNDLDDSLIAVDETVLTVGAGDNLYYEVNGTVAYTHGEDGKLYKGDGTTKKVVSYKGGYLDSNGNVVNDIGKTILQQAVVIEGVIYKVIIEDDSYVAEDGTVLVYSNDETKLVYKNNGTVAYTLAGEGKVYKGDGTTVEEVSILVGFFGLNGNALDYEGNVIAKTKRGNNYAVVIEETIYSLDADKNLVAASGTVLVYAGYDNLSYKDGTIAYTFNEEGKVYKGDGTAKEEISYKAGTLDASGNVVDDKGNIIAKGNEENPGKGNKTLVPTLLVVLILALLV